MKRMSIAAAVLIVWLLSPQMRAQDDLDSVLARAMKDSHVPAIAVLRIQHGKITGEAARGVRSIDAHDIVTTNDVWHIGSDGKAMTAAMIARLVDHHILSWDTPLEQIARTSCRHAASIPKRKPTRPSVSSRGLTSEH